MDGDQSIFEVNVLVSDPKILFISFTNVQLPILKEILIKLRCIFLLVILLDVCCKRVYIISVKSCLKFSLPTVHVKPGVHDRIKSHLRRIFIGLELVVHIDVIPSGILEKFQVALVWPDIH